MIKAVTPAEMRDMDQWTIGQFGIPGIVLMENAALHMTERILHRMGEKRGQIGIICGRGNNGGDGFAVARQLFQREFAPLIVILGGRDELRGDARTNLEILEKLCNDLVYIRDIDEWIRVGERLRQSDILVDAIFGTGLSKEVAGLTQEVILWMNDSHIPIFSIDIPSGIDGLTGKEMGTAIKAQETVTFAYPKIGHYLYPGREYTGKLSIGDISIPHFLGEKITREVLESKDIRRFLPPRAANTHKGSYGKTAVIAGSAGLSGAGVLAASAALRCGSGLVTLAVPATLMGVYQAKVTEIMTFSLEDRDGQLSKDSLPSIRKLLDDKDCLAIGPGLGKNAELFEILRNILGSYDIPIVIDADGINHICQDIKILRRTNAKLILTPHPGEMARLAQKTVGEVLENPLETAMKFADQWKVIVVLKGSTTVIAHPEGRVTFNLTGNPGMATGGSGDCLTGIIAGLISQGLEPYDAARVGCYLHGKAGDHAASVKGEYGMAAGDIIEYLPKTIMDIVGR